MVQITLKIDVKWHNVLETITEVAKGVARKWRGA